MRAYINKRLLLPFLREIRKRVSGRPPRDDVVSLVCRQATLVPTIRETLQQTLLMPGCAQRRLAPPSGLADNVAEEWVVNPVYLCELTDGYIHSSTGIIHDQRSDKYIVETAWGWGKYQTSSIRLFRGNSRKLTTLRPCYVFASFGYHGIVEDLAAVLHLIQQGHRFDIVIRNDNPWTLQLLQLLIPRDFDIIPVETGTWVSAPRMLITTKSAFGEFTHPLLLRALNRSAAGVIGNSQFGPRLFISRGDTNNRTHYSEPALAAFFRDQGYTVLQLAGLPVRDQVLAFRDATHVAGLHGAGLTNVVWAQTPTRILEFYRPEYFNSCYACLASSLRHEYRNFQLNEHTATDLNDLIKLNLVDPAQPTSTSNI